VEIEHKVLIKILAFEVFIVAMINNTPI